MKKLISVMLSVMCLLLAFSAAGCGKGKQVERQEEFMDKLQRLSLVYRDGTNGADDYGVYSREKVTDEIYFRPELYRLYSHCYTLFDGSGEIADAEEVRGLILQFDEETYDRFLTLCDWYLLMNGRMYVESCNDATEVARDLYNEKYGKDIMPGNWTAWSLEDRIALEDFVRDNPDFMPVEQHEKELRYLGVLAE
ncbi:MAG: hypothetical protein E7559_04670 [Ruminococcaceae bacterium]|nr:hypothetical protein [Oscillospiraceae bacterium]